MLNKFLNNIKQKMNKKVEGNNKKNIENLVVFLILLIITIIAINTIWGEDKGSENVDDNTVYKQLASNIENSNISENCEYDLEDKLEDILSKIQGVGKVKVLITYSESSEVVAMYNESYVSSITEEEDTNGGKRKIDQVDTDKEIIFEQKDGKSVPVTQKVVNPKIEGAIVTAKGAKDATVKTNIIQAVSTVTGLSSHKVQVFEMTD